MLVVCAANGGGSCLEGREAAGFRKGGAIAFGVPCWLKKGGTTVQMEKCWNAEVRCSRMPLLEFVLYSTASTETRRELGKMTVSCLA